MKTNNNTSLFQRDQVMESLKQSFVKLNPKIMVKNPVMFTVEISTLIMFIVTLFSATNDSQGSFAYNLLVFIILLVTLLFANFAEAIAEARGKAQADSLRKTREETPAKLNVNGQIKTVSSSQLKKGDVLCYVEAMKTYNAVRSEFDGTVTAICVNAGDAVSEDDVLMTIQ
jgi:K+-transporting ATPase ATPase B chain